MKSENRIENNSENKPKDKSIWHEHPIFSGLAGSVITLLAGLIGVNAKYNNYIPFDNISLLINNYLVTSNYVDEKILDLESPNEQFKMIEDTFKGMNDNYSSDISNSKSENQRLNNLIESLNSNAEDLKTNNIALSERIKELEQQETVELKESNLIIDGELMNAGDSINNSVAVINGNNYYSQSFLNTYILENDNHIKYDPSENSVVLGNQKPERIKLNWDEMVTDVKDVNYYSLGNSDTFSMGTNVYNEGCVVKRNTNFYIHLKNKYSKMAFTYGHVDNTSRGNLELTIFALDENKETYTTVIKTITLSGEMEPKETGEIPLSYASAIKIVVSASGDFDARYGLSNIYFYS